MTLRDKVVDIKVLNHTSYHVTKSNYHPPGCHTPRVLEKLVWQLFKKEIWLYEHKNK